MKKTTAIKRGDIGLADLAVAVRTLDLADPGHLQAAGHCLGFGNLRRTQLTQPRGGFEQRLKHRHTQPERSPPPARYGLPASPPAQPSLPDRAFTTELVALEPIATADDGPAEPPDFPAAAPKRVRAVPRLPLLPKNTATGVLAAAVCTRQAGRKLDLTALSQRIVQRRPLEPLPYRPSSSLSRGVQLVLDRGEAMTPFYRDQHDLAHTLATVVGAPQLEVFDFKNQPAEAQRWRSGGSPIRWRPRRGRPVLFSTDFGLGASRNLRPATPAKDWRLLASNLIQHGSPVVFLTPLPPGDWPHWLERAFNPVHWDPRTRAETVRSLVGIGHRLAP